MRSFFRSRECLQCLPTATLFPQLSLALQRAMGNGVVRVFASGRGAEAVEVVAEAHSLTLGLAANDDAVA